MTSELDEVKDDSGEQSEKVPEQKPEEAEVVDGKKVVYVKDRPFRSLFKTTAIVLVVGFALIYAVGFISGLAGVRVPYIDRGVAGDQWHKITKTDPGPSDWNELEKNK